MPSGANPTVSELVSQSGKEAQPTTVGKGQAQDDQLDGELKRPDCFGGEITEDEFAALPKESQQALVKWGTKLYGGLQRNHQETVKREREQFEELKAKALEELKEVVKPQQQVAQAKDAAKSYFDDLMDQTTDPAGRETLAKLRKGILQETKADEIWGKLEKIEKALGQFMQTNQLSRQDQLKTSFTQLSEAFQPLVGKYRNELLTLGVQYPNLSPRRLMQLVAAEDEYDQAVQAEGAKQTKKDVQRTKEAASSKPQATVGIPGLSEKDLIKPKSSLFGKRVNWKQVLPNVVAEVQRGSPT